LLHLWRRESQAALEFAEKAIALCKEKRIPFWQPGASINHGHALVLQGRTGEGISEALQGLSAYRSMGASVLQTIYLAQLAEMHLLAGQVDPGLGALEEALAAASETGERCMEAELFRLRAALQRAQRAQRYEARAEANLGRALEIARAQQARMWELRATMSLSRLWHSQGKQHAALQTLAAIYGWFTEGFDTPDLQEARALLEELAQPI
jgi:predicted ATPase